MNLNHQLFYYLYSFAHQNVLFDSLVIFLATDFALLICFALLYFLYKHEEKHRGLKELLIVIGGAILAWGIARIFKYFYPVARPDVLINAVMPLFAHGNGFDSFPSGHATFYSALATGLYFYHKQLGIFFGVCAILIGLARIIAGVHFPIDILAGLTLGIIVPSIIHYFIKK